MLHNKYFEILELFLGNLESEIYGRELIGKVPMSQKAIALALNELEKEGIVTSKKEGNMKFFRLNPENTDLKDIIVSAEINKKILFLKKFRKLAHLFKQDQRIVGIFGSYAKGTQKEVSDLDLFIIGEKHRKDYDSVGKPLDLNVSIKYFSEKEFINLLKNKNTLCKEIMESHILMFGFEKFIGIIWGNYGFN
ncbi:MAG: nucleotidyltransferase domain-containing protein [Nanoarchaeota archaeon]